MRFQDNKVSWVKDLVRMDKGNESWSDFEFRNRAQALVGIDEMLDDMLELLKRKGKLDNTYSKCPLCARPLAST